MADPQRIELPPRRLAVTEMIEWGKNTWLLSVGFGWQGRVREVFITGGIKAGADAEAWAADSCILLSRLLQSGWDAEGLLQSLSPMPDQASIATPSLMAVVLSKAIEIERAESKSVSCAYLFAIELDPWKRGRQDLTAEAKRARWREIYGVPTGNPAAVVELPCDVEDST